MLNLSDVTAYYLEVSFTDQQKLLLLNGFSILESLNFDAGFYEDKYVNLISNDNIASDAKSSTFLGLMYDDLKTVIGLHGASLSIDIPATLAELVELSQCLILLANLEDYSDVAYRLAGTSSNKTKMVDIFERYGAVPKYRLMEVIEQVEDKLIEALQVFCEPTLNPEQEPLDQKHVKYIQRFFEFIDHTPCLGYNLNTQGYPSTLKLEELVNLLPYSLDADIDKRYLTDPTQVALDVLSLLIVTQDDYHLPLLKLKRLGHLFTEKLETITALSNIILRLMNDFGLYLEEHQQKEKANDHQA